MKGTSKVIMGATLIMVVTLAVVLGLILVLLTELYCSLLLRRRRHLRASATASAAAATTIRTNASSSSPTSHPQQNHPPLFSSIYAQGVIQAPRSFLFPLVSSKEELTEAKKQLVELHQQAIQIQTRDFITSPRHLGLVSASSPSQPVQEVHGSVQEGDDDTSKGTICGEHLVYISNPIYENDEEGKESSSGSDTTFQTPHTSPSRLETIGSSGEDEEGQASPLCNTPPLSPMKKLPAEASSVSLKDATSLGNSPSESHTNNGLSSSSSATPCTSLSW